MGQPAPASVTREIDGCRVSCKSCPKCGGAVFGQWRYATHQPQAARSQPNARGAVSQLARLPHRGQQPLAHGLGCELRVEDALGCGRQLLDQIGLGPLPEEPRALIGCKAHAGALPLGEGPGLPWDFQQSFALPKQRHKNLPPLALERTSPNFHMLAWLVILFCPRLKKDWSEHAKLLEPRPCWW